MQIQFPRRVQLGFRPWYGSDAAPTGVSRRRRHHGGRDRLLVRRRKRFAHPCSRRTGNHLGWGRARVLPQRWPDRRAVGRDPDQVLDASAETRVDARVTRSERQRATRSPKSRLTNQRQSRRKRSKYAFENDTARIFARQVVAPNCPSRVNDSRRRRVDRYGDALVALCLRRLSCARWIERNPGMVLLPDRTLEFLARTSTRVDRVYNRR